MDIGKKTKTLGFQGFFTSGIIERTVDHMTGEFAGGICGAAADFQRDHTKLYSGLSFFTFVILKSLKNELNVFSYMPTT